METDVQPSGTPRHRRGNDPAALLLGLAGIAGCLLLAAMLWQHDRVDAEQHFLARHQPAFDAMVDALDDSTSLSAQLGRAMASASGDRTQLFDALANDFRKRFKPLELAAWLEPRPNAAGPSFRVIAAQGSSEQLDGATVETLLTREHAASLRRAADHNGLTVVDGPVLVRGTEGMRSGQLLLQPVFSTDSDQLRGIVATVIRLDRLLDSYPQHEQVHLHLFEVSAVNGRQLPLYSSQAGNASPTTRSLEAQPHLRRELEVGDRTWSTWLVPAHTLPVAWPLTHWIPLAAVLVLILGLTVIGQRRSHACDALFRRVAGQEALMTDVRRSAEQLQRENRQLDEDLCRTRARMRQRGMRLRELHRHSEALTAESWLFRRAFDDAAAAMALFDPETGVCFRANLAFSELLGYSGNDLTGLDFRELTHPADVQRTPRLVRSALRGGPDRFRAEKRYLHRNGYVIWCEVAGALLRDPDGKPLYVAIQAHDITVHRIGQDAPAPDQAIRSPQ